MVWQGKSLISEIILHCGFVLDPVSAQIMLDSHSHNQYL